MTDWMVADPIVGAAIGLFILPRAWRLARKAIRILIQVAPEGLDLGALNTQLRNIPGVVDVHDLHVWTLSSEMDVGTVHLMTGNSTDPHPVLDQARTILEKHGIATPRSRTNPNHTRDVLRSAGD